MRNILLSNCSANSFVVVKNKNSADTQLLIDTYVKNFPDAGRTWMLAKASNYMDSEYFIFRQGQNNSIVMSYTGLAVFKERELSYGYDVYEYRVDQLCKITKGIKKKLEL